MPDRAIRLFRWATGLTALSLTGAHGYYVIFSKFPWYDDEGYVMMSVQQFVEGHPLYDAVFSQYGPFYYLVRGALLAILRAPVSHDVTRLIALATWLLIAALGAWLLLRTTGSTVAALGTYFLGFAHLQLMTREPGHPQELALVLIVMLLVLAAHCGNERRSLALALGTGVLVACLSLTKVNLGTYAAGAVALTLVTVAVDPLWRIVQVPLVIGLACLPWVVMRDHVGAWAYGYASLASLWIAAVGVAARTASSDRRLKSWVLLVSVLAGVVTLIAICSAVVARGTSPAKLIDGTLLQPLSFAATFFTPVVVAPQAIVAAAVSLAFAVAVSWCHAPPEHAERRFRWPLWYAKFGAPILCLLLATKSPSVLLAVGPMFLWLILVRPSGQPWPYSSFLPRLALVSMGVLQTLQAYPVAGTQTVLASYLLLPAMVVCLTDAILEVRISARRFVAWRIVEASALVVVLLVGYAALRPANLRAAYYAAVPLSLPGASRVRLPFNEAARYHWLATNVRAHCTSLITLPGLNSLYFWTRLEPPTGFNTTAWPLLLDRPTQRTVVNVVAGDANACAIENEAGVRTGGMGDVIFDEPLMRFLRAEFRTVWELDGYRFKVRRSRVEQHLSSYIIHGQRKFDGSTVVAVPSGVLGGATPASYALSFRTSGPGVLLSCQVTRAGGAVAREWLPIVSVDLEGLLRTQVQPSLIGPITSAQHVADGRWHDVVVKRHEDRETAWLDGTNIGSRTVVAHPSQFGLCRAGIGLTHSRPGRDGNWLAFRGEMRNFRFGGPL